MKLLQQLLLIVCLLTSNALFAEITVDINSADKNTLVTMLNGIGEKKAEAIIEYRNQYGPFNSIEELSNVKGIGQSIIEKNQDLIVVNEP